MTTIVNRYGLYILSNTDQAIPSVERLKPAWIVLHNGEAKAENIALVRGASPGTKIAGRWYKEDSWYEDKIRTNPSYAADVVASNILSTGVADQCDAWITSNEIMQGWSDISLLSEYYIELQRLFPFPLFLASFSVKQPGDSGDPYGIEHMKRFYPAMYGGLEHGDYLAWHGYAKPRLFNGDMAFIDTDLDGIVRWEEHLWPSLPEELQHLPQVKSEFGWDALIGHPPPSEKGGVLHPLAAENVNDASQQLTDYARLWEERYGELGMPLEGEIIYCFGDSGGSNCGWSCYNVGAVNSCTEACKSTTFATPLVNAIPVISIGQPVEPPVEPPIDPPVEPPEEPMFERRVSDGIRAANIALMGIDASHVKTLEPDEKVYALKDAWTTADGQFPSGPDYDPENPYAAPDWSQEYQTPWESVCRADDFGADHHILFAIRVADGECKMMHDPEEAQDQQAEFATWTEGTPEEPDGSIGRSWVKPHSGWGNVIMYESSAYDPQQGQRGPFVLTKAGGGYLNSERPHGMGMPHRWHVSYFFVFVEMEAKTYYEDILGLIWDGTQPPNPDPDPDPTPEPEPEPEPVTGACAGVAIVAIAGIEALDNANERMAQIIAALLKGSS